MPSFLSLNFSFKEVFEEIGFLLAFFAALKGAKGDECCFARCSSPLFTFYKGAK